MCSIQQSILFYSNLVLIRASRWRCGQGIWRVVLWRRRWHKSANWYHLTTSDKDLNKIWMKILSLQLQIIVWQFHLLQIISVVVQRWSKRWKINSEGLLNLGKREWKLNTCIWDGSGSQIGRIFGKIPIRLWPLPPSFSENYVVNCFGKGPKKVLYNGLNWKWPFLLEFFQKIICFGTLTRPFFCHIWMLFAWSSHMLFKDQITSNV